MNDIIFFDLEVNRRTNKINDIGAICNGEVFHDNSLKKFENFLAKSNILCGHNIIHHDKPILDNTNIRGFLKEEELIDTLYLSALLFAEKPYHRLVKDYKIFSNDSEQNNPVADSSLCKELLIDEVSAFNTLPLGLQSIFFSLLNNQEPFRGFFKIVTAGKCESLVEAIQIYFQGQICANAEIALMVNDPITLAFALAIVNTKNTESILPKWMVKTHPIVSAVLNNLKFKDCSDLNCGYCNSYLNAKSGLLKYFGFEEFRKFNEKEDVPLQEEVVKATLEKKSFIAVFPTGGGKSLTFQLPALIQGDATRSLTVIISPLQSLMKDQIDVLAKRHEIVSAVTINGLLSPLERMEAIERVQEGGAHLLYISPESLRSKTINTLLLNRDIARFVIDEAHCFSSWGHDFRVDYLYIGEFIKELQKQKESKVSIPVSCFTATAKPAVVEDIKKYFIEKLGLQLDTYLASTSRKNLHYGVYIAEDENAKYNQLIQLLEQAEGPVIIYISRTRGVEELSEKLNAERFQALPYHGKMDRENRIANQNKFMNGEVDIIVATSAFGMGVDKENVEMVIHYDLSESLENYLQEAGRAGRKAEIEANCYILFDKNDLNKHFSLFYNSRINLKEIDQVWRGIKYLSGFRNRISRSALEIAKASGWDTEIYELETKIKTSIAVLEETGYVKRGLDAPRVFADSFLVKDYNKASEIIRGDTDLPESDTKDAIRILQRIIKEDETRVDYLSDVLGINRDDVERLIRMMRDKKILGDAKDLTAFLDISNSPKNSRKTATDYFRIEFELIKILKCKRFEIYLKEINETIINLGCSNSTPDRILDIMRYWDKIGYIKKTRTDKSLNCYSIHYKKECEIIKEQIEKRQNLSGHILDFLITKKSNIQYHGNEESKDKPVDFSILELKEYVAKTQGIFQELFNLISFEKALLYLNDIGAIRLDKGFIILYRPMTIYRVELDNKKRFKKEDYQYLANFYQTKIEQIHIIGEYAAKMLTDINGALTFADDYFKLSYDKFINKYFKDRKDQIKRPLTPEKFKKVFGDLSSEQLAIIKDSINNYILVTAGPGSGKTLVLVRKIASVLMMEDVKPEQFLMLTFSRAASLEFKDRLYKLLGPVANYIDIFTYHSYCFDITGRVGSLDKSKEVIKNTIKEINSGNIPIEKISRKSILVIDEFQDVNEEEFSLINTIISNAENIRVITVGDDDQNIYEFRGSDIKYMSEFKIKYSAKQYDLLTNFRSKRNLVEFSNQFAKRIKNRIKSQNLVSHINENGIISIFEYKNGSLITPLVNDVISRDFDGTTAILTRTNEEASLVNSELKKKGIRSKLILTNDNFQIKDLCEVRYFNNLILKNTDQNLGLITDQDWSYGKDKVREHYINSKNLELMLEIINKFDRSYHKKLRTDWTTYASEMQIENFIYPEQETVFVSTMHKAKGKEFDNVILLLENFKATTDENIRLLYVSITRAKSQLVIHTNENIFKDFNTTNIELIKDDNQYRTPNEIILHLSHRDVDLGFCKLDGVSKTISHLMAGNELFLSEDKKGLLSKNKKWVVKFSTSFKEKINQWINNGYAYNEASINHIVYWIDKDDNKECKVVLPVVKMSKQR